MAGKKLSIGSRAVAVAVMQHAVELACDKAIAKTGGDPDTAVIADELVKIAWDVEYKPNAERLVIVLDASIDADAGVPDGGE